MVCVLSCSLSFAQVPFEYNIIPEIKNNSVIDRTATKLLKFKLYEAQEDIYYNDMKVSIEDNSFIVDISKLVGNVSIQFRNSEGKIKTFNYNISDNKGRLEGYELVAGKTLNTYVTTINNITVIYTDKEVNAMSKLQKYILELPSQMLENINLIKMIPYSNTSNIAGTSKDQTITLYNFKKYDQKTQKNIIFHELAHSWANKLMDKKIIDYSYTDYKDVVAKDNNFISGYAKNFANDNNGRLSEDFADSVAFYFINQKQFAKTYPNRTDYIKSLL
jgi:hypothetical protein